MKRFLLIILLLFFTACAHIVSPEMRRQVDTDVSSRALFLDPQAFTGKTVILGGFIAEIRTADSGSSVEVVQNPLDYRGRPSDRDQSYGRFIVLHEGMLDAAVFKPGRDITVAGEVVGTTVKPLGEMEYTYVVIKSRELHLFKPQERIPVHFGISIWKSF